MDVFAQSDYKTLLKTKLAEKKQLLGNRFTYERLAQRIGVQKTYLSRVLSQEGPHLNEDQLYRIASDLGFSREERRFLQLLLERARSSLPERQSELDGDIAAVVTAHQRSEARLLVAPTLDANAMADYFLNPEVTLVHMFLCIERYRQQPAKIAAALGICGEDLSNILALLERQGLIELRAGEYQVVRDRTHLPVDSPLYRPYRALQRLRSLERCQKLPMERTYNFSVVFTASENARQQIRANFLKFLATLEQLAGSAADEDVYQLNFDLFDWSL